MTHPSGLDKLCHGKNVGGFRPAHRVCSLLNKWRGPKPKTWQMLKLITIVFLQSASAASILGLYFTLFTSAERPWWHWLLVFFVALVTICLILNDVWSHVTSAPKSFSTNRKINNYMKKWISNGGRVVIFSRDMSWAKEVEIQNLLSKKALGDELTICIERPIELTTLLAQQGARVICYGELNHVPRSRFTIVDFGREGARVAVGAKIKNKHIIQEFQSGEHPFFGVAEDMVKTLIAYDDARQDVQTRSK